MRFCRNIGVDYIIFRKVQKSAYSMYDIDYIGSFILIFPERLKSRITESLEFQNNFFIQRSPAHSFDDLKQVQNENMPLCFYF